MFARASRHKLRFTTDKGRLTAEQLWDLPITSASGNSLKSIGDNLHKELDVATGSSEIAELLNAKQNADHGLIRLKYDIVVYIIGYKVNMAKGASERIKRRAKKQEILGILKDKQNDSLRAQSIESLTKMLDDL